MSDLPPIDFDSRLRINPGLVLREESDACALLFDPDSGRVHLLNPTAVAVCKRLDGCNPLKVVVALLADEFDGMGPEAGEQVLVLVRSLAALGAVKVIAGQD